MEDSASLAAASSTRPVVPRPAAAAPQDSLFIALLNAFRSSGGLQRLSALQAIRSSSWDDDVIEALPARVADRSVLGITWNREAWVPNFQFDGHGATKLPAATAFLELTPSHDPWELAAWFVTPSTWLQHVRPIDLLEMAPTRVLEAARADRYVANGVDGRFSTLVLHRRAGSDTEDRTTGVDRYVARSTAAYRWNTSADSRMPMWSSSKPTTSTASRWAR